jgi:hypothetical protein
MSTPGHHLIVDVSSLYLSLDRITGSKGIEVFVKYPPCGDQNNRIGTIHFQPMQKASFVVEESTKECLENGSASCRLSMVELSKEDMLATSVSKYRLHKELLITTEIRPKAFQSSISMKLQQKEMT